MKNWMRFLGLIVPLVVAFFALKALVGWIQSMPSETEHRMVDPTAEPLPQPAEQENERSYSGLTYRYGTRRIWLLGGRSVEVKTVIPEVKLSYPNPDVVKIEKTRMRINEMREESKKRHSELMKSMADLKNHLDTVAAEQPE